MFDSADYSRLAHPVFHFDNIDHAVQQFSKDGIYSVNIGHDHMPLDIFAQNVTPDAFEANNTLLVGLSGAVIGRRDKHPPFFGFLGVSSKLCKTVPFVSISDPSLYMDKNLSLAWYAGNQYIPDIIEKVCYFLDSLAKIYQCKIVVLGGSGGGYASLRIVESIATSNISAFVWNPQTTISNYHGWAVKKYLEICYPDKCAENPLPDDGDYSRYFDEFKVINSVQYVKKKGRIIYFINSDDQSHIFKHMNNFFERCVVSRINDRNFISQNAVIHVGNFGPGHSAPQKQVVINTIDDILHNKPIYSCRFIEENTGKEVLYLDTKTNFYLKNTSPKFYRHGNFLICSFSLSEFDGYAVSYTLDDALGNSRSIATTADQTVAFDLTSFKSDILKCEFLLESVFGRQKRQSITIILTKTKKLNAL